MPSESDGGNGNTGTSGATGDARGGTSTGNNGYGGWLADLGYLGPEQLSQFTVATPQVNPTYGYTPVSVTGMQLGVPNGNLAAVKEALAKVPGLAGLIPGYNAITTVAKLAAVAADALTPQQMATFRTATGMSEADIATAERAVALGQDSGYDAKEGTPYGNSPTGGWTGVPNSGGSDGVGSPITAGNTSPGVQNVTTALTTAQQAALDQATANRESATFNTGLNRVNQITPDGSSTWSTTPSTTPGGPDTWTQTIALSPEQQALKDAQTRLSQGYANAANTSLGNLTTALSNPIDTSGLAAVTQTGGNSAGNKAVGVDIADLTKRFKDVAQASGGGASAGVASTGGGDIARTFDTSGVRDLPGTIDDTSRRRVEEALMARLNPQLERDRAALQSRLLNSGIEIGSNAYNSEVNNFGQQSNDARMQAILAGGQEESRQVGLIQGLNAQEYDQALKTGQFAQNADITRTGQALQASIANANNATQASISSANNSTSASIANAANAEAANRAYVAAVLGGSQQNASVVNQNFQNGLADANFSNDARRQSIEEQAFLRTQALNEANTLRTGAQVTTPTFSNYYTGGNAGTTPVFDASLATQNQQNLENANDQAGQNALWGGLANLVSSWL